MKSYNTSFHRNFRFIRKFHFQKYFLFLSKWIKHCSFHNCFKTNNENQGMFEMRYNEKQKSSFRLKNSCYPMRFLLKFLLTFGLAILTKQSVKVLLHTSAKWLPSLYKTKLYTNFISSLFFFFFFVIYIFISIHANIN